MNDAGVGDKLVDATEFGCAGLDHADHLFFVADIGPVTDRAAADLHRCGVGGITVDVRAEHAAALVCESRCDRKADAGAGARHDRGLARQVWMRHQSPRECVCAITFLTLRPPMPSAPRDVQTVFAYRPEHDKAEPRRVIGKPDRMHPEITQDPCHGL